jgi:hypothetical protein
MWVAQCSKIGCVGEARRGRIRLLPTLSAKSIKKKANKKKNRIREKSWKVWKDKRRVLGLSLLLLLLLMRKKTFWKSRAPLATQQST